MSEGAITLEEIGPRGRHVLAMDGGIAELTFSRLGAAQVIADLTEVPDALKGAGPRLVERLVADAREMGFRIVPL